MTVRIVPTLEAMAGVYRLPTTGGPESPRFHAYVELGRRRLPVSGYNPMTGKDVLRTVEALLDLDAEALAGESAARTAARLGIVEPFDLSITVATPGMWTDRLGTEVEHRLLGGTCSEILLWHGDHLDAATVVAEAAAQVVRSAWVHLHGPPATVADAAGQEGLAAALSDPDPDGTDGVGADGPDPAVAEALAVVGDDTALSTMVALLYGDAAAAMGWTPLGLADRAGLALSAALAATALAGADAASLLRRRWTPAGPTRRAVRRAQEEVPSSTLTVDVVSGQPQIADDILALVGDTPLVRLGRISAGLPTAVVAKLETTNPGGSVKDRPAVAMIDAAEREGRLRPGGTIVEPTSGNTGVGLAIVAAQRGYRCIFVMTDKVSEEKVALLRAYGAEVVVCPVAVAPDDPRSYYSTAERLVNEIPGAFRPDQYSNPVNPWSHEQSTGPELWRQTAGRITHFVAGVGTGGTITGVARFLKAQDPDVRIIGADPAGSVYSGGSGRPYLVEGVGEDFWPTTFDPSLVDETIAVDDHDSFMMARRVAREEGLLIGGSGGTAVAAALRVAERASPDDLVVVLIPDSGRGYLTKVFDDGWMASYGFLTSEGPTVGEILAAKVPGDLPPLVYVRPEATARQAVELMRVHGLSQLPVAVGDLPLAAAEVLGAVDELALMHQAFHDASVLDRRVGDVMGPRLPTIGAGQPVAMAVECLESAPAVLVISGGRPCAVLGRTDVLRFVSECDAGREL